MEKRLIELTRGSLRLETHSSNAGAGKDAWKSLIGQKLVAARLNTLPEARVRRGALVTSAGAQVVLVALLLALPIFFPQQLGKIVYEVTPIAAPAIDATAPVKTPVVRTEIPPAPAKVEIPVVREAKLRMPRALVAPKVQPAEVRNAEMPKLAPVLSEVKFDPTAEPVRPREPVKTGVLNAGSAAAAAIGKPVEAVQTGGFGDPQGLAGDVNPNPRANVARTGAFDWPEGPGNGNGTGGGHGARGTVASAGFGNGTAIAGNAKAARPVQAGGFATAAVDPEAGKSTAKPHEAAAAMQPVVIVSKPNPVYTAEARQLGIEGEVLVEVIFRAAGQVQTVRVVKGLGHGLDEAAVRAAEQIRFQPAQQQGQAVDFPATVHIVFQLAY